MSSAITVMLVDDHAVVRAGYRLLLSQSGNMRVVAEAARGEEACQLYLQYRPDITVLDLNLPGLGGLRVIRHILGHDPGAKVLVFSIHDEPVYVERAMEAGALGYISKSCAPEMLVEAVVQIAAGGMFIEPVIAERLQQSTLVTGAMDVDPQCLSAREFDVFCLLARGMTTREVATELKLSQKTVANYATTIKEKLQLGSTAALVRLAYQHGILR